MWRKRLTKTSTTTTTTTANEIRGRQSENVLHVTKKRNASREERTEGDLSAVGEITVLRREVCAFFISNKQYKLIFYAQCSRTRLCLPATLIKKLNSNNVIGYTLIGQRSAQRERNMCTHACIPCVCCTYLIAGRLGAALWRRATRID